MSAASVIAAIKAVAGASINGTPIYWPNETIVRPDPGDGTAFIWAEIRGLRSDIAAIGIPGANTLRDDGFIRFHICIPYGTGIEAAQTICDSLAALYRLKNIAGIQYEVPTLPEGSQNPTDGMWHIESFSCPFYLFYAG